MSQSNDDTVELEQESEDSWFQNEDESIDIDESDEEQPNKRRRVYYTEDEEGWITKHVEPPSPRIYYTEDEGGWITKHVEQPHNDDGPEWIVVNRDREYQERSRRHTRPHPERPGWYIWRMDSESSSDDEEERRRREQDEEDEYLYQLAIESGEREEARRRQEQEEEDEFLYRLGIEQEEEDEYLTRIARAHRDYPPNDIQLGTRAYAVNEDNIDQVEADMLYEIFNYRFDQRNPLFILVRMESEFRERSVKYMAIRYSIENLQLLFRTIRCPHLAWELFISSDGDATSDIPHYLCDRSDDPEVFKVSHLAFFNAAMRDVFSRSELATIYNCFPAISENRRRVGRFMSHYLSWRALELSSSYEAMFWKNNKNKEFLENELQIPWYSPINLQVEEENGEFPVKSEIYSVPCLLYAIKDQVDAVTYNIMKHQDFIYHVGTKARQFTEVLNKRGYYVKIARIFNCKDKPGKFKINSDSYPRNTSKCTSGCVHLMFWEGHWMKYKEITYETSKGLKQVCLLRLLEKSKNEGLIKPMNAYQYSKMYDNYSYDAMLQFNDKLFIEQTPNDYRFTEDDYDKTEYKERKGVNIVYFADFECTTDEQWHRPFLLVAKGVKVVRNGETMEFQDIDDVTFTKEYCGVEFIHYLCEKYGTNAKPKSCSVRVYFHNLHYDFSFVVPHLEDVKQIMKGNKLYSAKGLYRNYNGKKILLDFWDSLPIFQCSLKKAAESYLTPLQKSTIKKELFPYNLYTYSFFNEYPSGFCPYETFVNGFECEKERNEFCKTDVSEFMDASLGFNYQKYAVFYCTQDVNCLKYSMINFFYLLYGKHIEGITSTPPFNIDLLKFRTASSIGYEYFQRSVLFTEKEGKMVERFPWAVPKNALRALIQKTIRGGRVMVRENKQTHYKCLGDGPEDYDMIQDFDAVSEYPSAMSVLWITDGIPKFIKGNFNQNDFLNMFVPPEWDDESYKKPYKDGCVHLTFLNTPRQLCFPELCVKDAKTKLNNYRNYDHQKVDTWVNVIDIYNLIDFQNAEFIFDAAVVWDGERHLEIQDSIKALFEFRLVNKKHPIQAVTKLMMNSIFGKSILKVANKEKIIVDRYKWRDGKQIDNWEEFFNANIYRIHRFSPLGDNKIEVEILKRDVSSSLNIFGSNVLAMARRIISRVMSLAEYCEEQNPELVPGLFYTDTDSMHITQSLLDALNVEWGKRYATPLIGNRLGQFHCDFDSPANFLPGEEVMGSIESYFIMKKVYVDKLLGNKGSIGYHIRMKGIPTSLVKFSDYEKIFDGDSVEFDLLSNGLTSFFYKDGHVGTRRKMTREIMTRETREARKNSKIAN